MPKIAALLAAARLPDPEPVPTVSYKSAGRVLVIGALDAAERAAALLADALDVTLFTQGPGNAGGAQERRYPVLGGQHQALSGWLGAFELEWEAQQPDRPRSVHALQRLRGRLPGRCHRPGLPD